MQDYGQTMIHPLLEKRIRNEQIARNVFLAVIALVMAALVGYFLFFFKESRIGLFIGGALAASAILLGIMIVHLTGQLHQKYMRANRLLNYSNPREMTIKNLGFVDLSGAYAELRPRGAPEQGPPWALVTLNVNKYKPLPKKPTPAQVFLEDGAADNYLVVAMGDLVYWGSVTTPETRAVNWQRFKWFFVGMTGLFLVVLAILVVEQYYKLEDRQEKLALAEASLNWPLAPGSILSSEVVNVRIRRGKSSYKGHGAAIYYQYTVNGQKYQGDRIHFGYQPQRDLSPFKKLVTDYPPQKKVRIAYDPQNPRESVLEPGHVEECRARLQREKPGLIVAFIGGSVGMLVMVGLLVFFSRQRNKALKDLGA